MTSLNRRRFATIFGASALFPIVTSAQDHGGHHGDHESESTPEVLACSFDPYATPTIVPYESDIPFDQAYIDTMIPHHNSVVALATEALDVLEDERLVTIAQAVIDTQPGEVEQLKAFREEWYGDAEPAEMTDEMMMVTMGDMDAMGGCTGQHGMEMDLGSHEDMMNLMDSEWILEEFAKADNKDLGFIDIVIPHHEMAVHQSYVGLQLAEHEELRTLCQEVIDAQEAEIKELKLIREDLAD